jgi:hypothetical protein
MNDELVLEKRLMAGSFGAGGTGASGGTKRLAGKVGAHLAVVNEATYGETWCVRRRHGVESAWASKEPGASDTIAEGTGAAVSSRRSAPTERFGEEDETGAGTSACEQVLLLLARDASGRKRDAQVAAASRMPVAVTPRASAPGRTQAARGRSARARRRTVENAMPVDEPHRVLSHP